MRKYDLESLPTILKLSQKGTIGLGEYYNLWGWPPREIEWEKDWKDDNPVFIDYVEVWPEKVLIGTSGEFMLDFMAHKYYGLGEIILEPRDDIYVNKEDKMKPVKDRKIREKVIRHHIYRYLDHGAHLFALDGYAIIGYRIGHEYKFRFWVDRKQKKFQKLKPLPLDKIEFLKEDSPELFK